MLHIYVQPGYACVVVCWSWVYLSSSWAEINAAEDAKTTAAARGLTENQTAWKQTRPETDEH